MFEQFQKGWSTELRLHGVYLSFFAASVLAYLTFTLHSEIIACAKIFLKNYFLRNCAKLSQTIAGNIFLRIIFVRLRKLVVALCFLAVSIDALVKQLSILEADYTTLETLQKLGFEDDCTEKNWDM